MASVEKQKGALAGAPLFKNRFKTTCVPVLLREPVLLRVLLRALLRALLQGLLPGLLVLLLQEPVLLRALLPGLLPGLLPSWCMRAQALQLQQTMPTLPTS